MDVVVWLRSLGLGKYEAAFRENEITEKVLPNLTAEDLKELGVAALGHRRTLLDAIAALRNDASGKTPSVDAATASSAPSPQPEDRAERRQVTVMLVATVTALKTHAPLQTRIGIATGLVVVGDLIGSGASQEQAIVGETPNLAARLQAGAEPNSVVIAESTRKLVGNLFELEDLGAQDLKGIVGPVRAWAALRDSSAEGRFEAFHASGLTELVGREEELDLLAMRSISGAVSRDLPMPASPESNTTWPSPIFAFDQRRSTTEPHTRLRYFCSSQRTDSAFFPIISQMERAAGFAHNETAKAKLDKLDAVLAQSLT